MCIVTFDLLNFLSILMGVDGLLLGGSSAGTEQYTSTSRTNSGPTFSGLPGGGEVEAHDIHNGCSFLSLTHKMMLSLKMMSIVLRSTSMREGVSITWLPTLNRQNTPWRA